MHQASAIGGGSYCLLNIIKELDHTLFEVSVVLKSEGPLADELRKMGVEVVIFPMMAFVPYNQSLWKFNSVMNYIRVKRSLKPFEDLLHKVKADILYLNNMMIYPYLKVAKKQGMKTVVHVREHWPLNEHKQQLKWARRCVYQYADLMISINRYSASMFPEKKATIVYDWIDMSDRYKSMPMSDIFGEDMTNKKVLLYTGGSQIIKGTDYVVESFINNIKGNDYRLLILGIGELKPLHGIKHNIKLLLERFGYYYYDKKIHELLSSDTRIKYIPSVYELNHIIEQSHCFISYFRIPHANLALAENIIMGNPCIAADTEEAREYSGNGQYAMLVNPMNNRLVFNERLTSFLSDHEYWRAAALNGSQTISRLFDMATNVSRLNECLSRL